MEAFDPIVIKVKGDASDVLAMLAALKKEIGGLGDTSKKTNDKVKDDFGGSGKKIDDFGRLVVGSMRDGKTAMESLRLKSKDLRGEIERLRAEFGKTGSKSIFGDLKSAESDLKKITGYLSQMSKPNKGQGGGLFSAVKDLIGGMKGGGAGAPAEAFPLGELLGYGGAVLAPGALATVAATVNAALITGVGMGGLALGIKEQMNNSVVAGAWQRFTQMGHDAMVNGSDVLAGPLRDAFGRLGDWVQSLNLRQVFAPLAAEVQPLFAGFRMMVDRMLPGLNTAMRTAAPFLDELAHMLPSIGSAITHMFDEMSKGAGGGKIALSMIISGIDLLIVGIGKFVRYGSDAFAWFTTTMADLSDDMAHFGMKAFGWLPGMGDKFTDLDKRTGQLRDQINATARSGIAGFGDLSGAVGTANTAFDHQVADLAALNDQFDTLLGKNLSEAQAQLALATDQATLSFQRGKHAFDEHYASGRANMQMFLQMVSDLKAVYEADVQVNGVTAQNTKAYRDGVNALLAQADAAGATSRQIQALKDQFLNLGGVMSGMDGLTTNLYVNVHSTGMAAFAGGRGYYAQSGVHSWSARAPEHYDRSGVYRGRPGGYFMGEASTGDEALIGRTSNPGRALAALATAAGWHNMAITPSRGGAFSGPQAAGGGDGGPGSVMADVYLDVDKVGYAMVRWNGRFSQRSNVTLAGHPPDVTIGQLR